MKFSVNHFLSEYFNTFIPCCTINVCTESKHSIYDILLVSISFSLNGINHILDFKSFFENLCSPCLKNIGQKTRKIQKFKQDNT